MLATSVASFGLCVVFIVATFTEPLDIKRLAVVVMMCLGCGIPALLAATLFYAASSYRLPQLHPGIMMFAQPWMPSIIGGPAIKTRSASTHPVSSGDAMKYI